MDTGAYVDSKHRVLLVLLRLEAVVTSVLRKVRDWGIGLQLLATQPTFWLGWRTKQDVDGSRFVGY